MSSYRAASSPHDLYLQAVMLLCTLRIMASQEGFGAEARSSGRCSSYECRTDNPATDPAAEVLIARLFGPLHSVNVPTNICINAAHEVLAI